MALKAEQLDWSKPVRMTEEEYLAFEEQAEGKHEFYDGVVRPLTRLIECDPAVLPTELRGMAGGTYEHSLVISNAIGALSNALRGTGCRSLDSNMRVRSRASKRYSYPDATILCGAPQFNPPGRRTTIVNPLAVVEVLSPGTEKFDRTEKLQRYQQIETLRECILIESDTPFVQTIYREDDGHWSFKSWLGLNAVAELRSVPVKLPLAELYRDVPLSGSLTEPE